MAQDLTELEVQRINEAAGVALKRFERRYGETLGDNRSVWQGAAQSLGTGWEYDGNGDVIEPREGGFWKAGMAVGSAPVRG